MLIHHFSPISRKGKLTKIKDNEIIVLPEMFHYTGKPFIIEPGHESIAILCKKKDFHKVPDQCALVPAFVHNSDQKFAGLVLTNCSAFDFRIEKGDSLKAILTFPQMLHRCINVSQEQIIQIE